MKVNMKKTSITAALIVSIVLLWGWTSFTLLAQKDIHHSLSPDPHVELIPNRVDIKGLAWQVYLKLMDMGRRSL